MATLTVTCIVSLLAFLTLVDARIPGPYTGGEWQTAHATFYGGNDASGTMGIILFCHSVFQEKKSIPLLGFRFLHSNDSFQALNDQSRNTHFEKYELSLFQIIIFSFFFFVLSLQEGLVGTETCTAKGTE